MIKAFGYRDDNLVTNLIAKHIAYYLLTKNSSMN